MNKLLLVPFLALGFIYNAFAADVTLKESLNQFAGSYTVEACFGNGNLTKEEDEIEITTTEAEFEKAIIFKIGSGIDYKFTNFVNTLEIPRQKMSNGCLSSISSWIVEDNLFAAKTFVRHFDKTFCKLEKKKKAESHVLSLKNYNGFLILDHQQMIGDKTIQALTCKLVK